MNILSAITVTNHVFDTVDKLSSITWDRKKLKKVAIISLAFIGCITTIICIDHAYNLTVASHSNKT